jgi:ribosomal protein S27E
MATFELSCPECGNTSKVPDNLAGKKIKCKKCQKIIIATPGGKSAGTAIKSGAKPSGTKKPEYDDRNPYVMREENLAARCPFCAQLMDPPDSKICIHCGYNMQRREREASKITDEITAADYLLWHLPTFGSFVGIMVLIGICVFCGVQMSDWVSGSFADGLVKPGCFTVWIVIMCLYPIWAMIRIIFRRLVWNFTPPEKEVKLKGDFE